MHLLQRFGHGLFLPFHEPRSRRHKEADFERDAVALLLTSSATVHGPDARPMLEVETSHEPGSRRPWSAHFEPGRRRRRLMSATIQGLKARSFLSANSLPATEQWT